MKNGTKECRSRTAVFPFHSPLKIGRKHYKKNNLPAMTVTAITRSKRIHLSLFATAKLLPSQAPTLLPIAMVNPRIQLISP